MKACRVPLGEWCRTMASYAVLVVMTAASRGPYRSRSCSLTRPMRARRSSWMRELKYVKK